MYMPPHYMSELVLVDVLCDFDWPAPFKVENDLPIGIAVVFPRCRLYISEVPESEIQLYFSKEQTGLGTAVALKSVMVAMGGVETPGVEQITTSVPSVDLVKTELRNLFKILLAHFRSSLLGNFEWVPTYKAWEATWKRT